MEVPVLPFSAMDDREVQAILRQHRIGLTVEEARSVERLLGRPPTLVEAVIWGIQGSEHCSYKSSRRFLATLPTEGRHVILGPKEDAGIVAITDDPAGKRWGLCISHESHNHPSQIVPYEGAATGIGGTVRDVACMGARVVGCLDALRLGDLRNPETRTIAREVVRGIAGYGNPLGVPNLGGDTVFDATYNDACLVNAIAVGIVREDEVIHSSVPAEARELAYDIILVGKPTDRSGFGGAAFASASLMRDDNEKNTGAVQEPNPFLERHLLVSTYALFDWLAETGNIRHVSFKDLGAGGVVCSTVEQVAEQGFGAEINLDLVHTSIANLPPEVIACAETQERFCWMCRSTLTRHILHHYNAVWDLPHVAEGARASVIGRVTQGGLYRLTHGGHVVCEAPSVAIVKGLREDRPTGPQERVREEPRVQCIGEHVRLTLPRGEVPVVRSTLGEVFRALLSSSNAASVHPILLHYDKSVMGNTILEAGEADASVIAPLQDLGSYCQRESSKRFAELPESERWRGVALTTDGNPRYGRISPYWQGANAAVEAMCNVAAVGAVPRALTDCLNYGNPEVPEQLFDLAEGVRGIGDAARGIRIDAEPVPVISGNVSLYNCHPDGRAIDPSAIVCCIGILPDARKAVSMQVKQSGSFLFLVGDRRNECGGSSYYHMLEEMGKLPRDSALGAFLPQPDFASVGRMMHVVTSAIDAALVRACHDISDGGLLLALFEMTLPQRKLGGKIGIEISLDALHSALPS
ncbi:phosphoribosylformylglycinamidine synthase subunit PurL, partial [Candidatus Peregrinibacteria bacterium]|nr:phosphoribosylformylglycinamidine synthase subunit PurL [Candidatus Peregrinibacteria bacterium]